MSEVKTMLDQFISKLHDSGKGLLNLKTKQRKLCKKKQETEPKDKRKEGKRKVLWGI